MGDGGRGGLLTFLVWKRRLIWEGAKWRIYVKSITGSTLYQNSSICYCETSISQTSHFNLTDSTFIVWRLEKMIQKFNLPWYNTKQVCIMFQIFNFNTHGKYCRQSKVPSFIILFIVNLELVLGIFFMSLDKLKQTYLSPGISRIFAKLVKSKSMSWWNIWSKCSNQYNTTQYYSRFEVYMK